MANLPPPVKDHSLLPNDYTDAARFKQTLLCPREAVGRVIGKNGETIRALQVYTKSRIAVDQTTNPIKIVLTATPDNLRLTASMLTDIINGSFKGFALLRQYAARVTLRSSAPPAAMPRTDASPESPVYFPGYGFVLSRKTSYATEIPLGSHGRLVAPPEGIPDLPGDLGMGMGVGGRHSWPCTTPESAVVPAAATAAPSVSNMAFVLYQQQQQQQQQQQAAMAAAAAAAGALAGGLPGVNLSAVAQGAPAFGTHLAAAVPPSATDDSLVNMAMSTGSLSALPKSAELPDAAMFGMPLAQAGLLNPLVTGKTIPSDMLPTRLPGDLATNPVLPQHAEQLAGVPGAAGVGPGSRSSPVAMQAAGLQTSASPPPAIHTTMGMQDRASIESTTSGKGSGSVLAATGNTITTDEGQWIRVCDPDGRSFFLNPATGVSSWAPHAPGE